MAIFLRENGVLTMGNKTPVTILQETLQRRGQTPQYELIYNGVGTLDPVFKFQVSGAGLTAIGDGKSKKEAKHDAAASLLKRMQISKAVTENSKVEATEEMDIASPYSGALKQNFVGMLDETCVINKIPIPVYIQTGEEGPPHARIFKMQCNVSSCIEVAIARTKKQAKHMAAQLMITRVAGILGDKYISHAERALDTDIPEEAQNLKAIENGVYRHDLSIHIADMHNVFYYRTEEFILPQMFLDMPTKPEKFYEQLKNPKEFLDELMRGLEGTCKITNVTFEALREALEETEKDCHMFMWDEESSPEEEEVDLSDVEEDKSYVDKYTLEEFDLDSSDEDGTQVSSNQLSNSDVQVKTESAKEGKINLECCKEQVIEGKINLECCKDQVIEGNIDLEFRKEQFINEEIDLKCCKEQVIEEKVDLECCKEQVIEDKVNLEWCKDQVIEEKVDLECKQQVIEEKIDLDCCKKNLEQLHLEDYNDEKLKNSITEGNCDSKLNMTTVIIKPIFLFLSIECPQGLWAFWGMGETQKEAVDQAAVYALNFLQIMAIPRKTKKEVKKDAV